MPLAESPTSSHLRRALVIAAGGLVAAIALSFLLPGYVLYLAITATIAAIALIGLGVVTGTAGMISLCQLTFAAVGAWTVSWLNLHEAPGGFLVWLVAGALAAGILGAVVGIPALRVRGVNLAVVTLGFAAAADATLMKMQFPGAPEGVKVLRPEFLASDQHYFLFAATVLIMVAFATSLLHKSRLGASWKFIAFSERATSAAGSSVRRAKIWAFAVSGAIAGVAGGLMAAQVGSLNPVGFSAIQSLAMFVLAIVVGSHLTDMAIFGGILWVAIPELLKTLGISQDWAFVLFGALGVQAIASGSNLGQSVRDAAMRRRRLRPQAYTPPSPPTLSQPQGDRHHTAVTPLLTVSGLSVQFGKLHALNNVDLVVGVRQIVGLIGPNGAGKSTFVDALSGFLPGHGGTVLLGQDSLDGLAPHDRALLGLRRTFQQERVPPTLTVGEYARFMSRGQVDEDTLREALDFFDCPPCDTQIAVVDVGSRRILEVAANLAARPRIIVLDEPAAGLSHDQRAIFTQRMGHVPEKFGCSVLIIEHDLDLIRSVCASITVLNFGEVLASGAQEEILNEPAVLSAYMGETEML